ncbi:helix-turn-helix domain-containing protein [Geofilum rhodophaeum]|uniref:helix-turn-helix domain-containing protein n=1 Tax=Geofilum rhodophaeum TaxID=1965019 RepID=UPI000B5243C5|nr:transcriptional regulator [Geofilum rhodophaeum]
MQIKILKTEEEYFQALDRLEEIFQAKPGTPEGDEAELLSLVIRKYDEANFPLPETDPIEAIEFMMEQQDIKPKDLVGIIGDKTLVSKVLNRKRKLTIDMIRRLNEKLNLPFDVLLKDYSLLC